MGLYDEHNAGILAGAVNAAEYWAARASAEKLEEALRTEQPWNAIAAFLPVAKRTIEAALAIYPNHRDLLSWRKKAEEVRAEVDPDYGDDWAPGFPWAQLGFVKGWTSLEHARFAASEGDGHTAGVKAREARSALEACHDVHRWPERWREYREAGLRE